MILRICLFSSTKLLPSGVIHNYEQNKGLVNLVQANALYPVWGLTCHFKYSLRMNIYFYIWYKQWSLTTRQTVTKLKWECEILFHDFTKEGSGSGREKFCANSLRSLAQKFSRPSSWKVCPDTCHYLLSWSRGKLFQAAVLALSQWDGWLKTIKTNKTNSIQDLCKFS